MQTQEVLKTAIPKCQHDYEVSTIEADNGRTIWKSFVCKKCGYNFTKKFIKDVDFPELEKFKKYVDKPFLFTASHDDIKKQVGKAVHSYLKKKGERKRGLVFHDKRGTGKTHYAIQLLKYFKRKQLKSIYALNFSLFLFEKKREMNIQYDQANRPPTEIIQEEALSRDVLLLDEVGKGKNSDWSNGLLYMFVDSFYMDENKFLILTTNLKPEELDKELDPAVASRLYEFCEFVSFNHLEDMRRY